MRNKDYFRQLLYRYPNSFITVSYIDKEKQIAKLNEEYNKSNSEKAKQELEKLKHIQAKNIPVSGTLTVIYGDTAELLYAGFDDKFKSYNSASYSWSNSIMKAFEINPNIKYVNLGGVENDGHLLNFRIYCNEFYLAISPLYYLFKLALKHNKFILKFIKK